MIKGRYFGPVANGSLWSSSRIVLIPIMALSQVLGFTFAYGYSRKWMRIAHRAVVVVVLVLVFVHEVPSILFWMRASHGLHRTLVKFETSTRWALFFGNYILTTVYSGRVKAIVDDLLASDLQLPEDVRLRVFRFHVLHLVANAALIVACDILGHDFVWTNSNHNSVTSTIYIFNDFMILWSGLQFLHITNVIRELFKVINARLDRFTAHAEVDVIKGEVVRLRNCHLHLYNTCRSVNSCFSVQLLCIILFSVIQTTYALRAFISEVIRPDLRDHPTEAILDVIWGLLYMLFVYQIIAVGDHTTFESKRSSVIVHHLINDHFESRGLEKELELFSLQIHQHQAVFSIWLFDLRFTLLNTLIGLLTTYMIILITFQEEWKAGGLSGWEFKVDG